MITETSSRDELISKFIKIYYKMPDFELEPEIYPPLWFFRRNNQLTDERSKKEAAQYFLLSASLQDTLLMGNCRNARLLLNYLYKEFGDDLYGKTEPRDFIHLIEKWKSECHLFGSYSFDTQEIAKVLAGVNSFIWDTADGDVLAYAKMRYNNKETLAEFASRLMNIYRMGDQYKGKVWLYLRWMVRDEPDLGLFGFPAQELMIPLTSHVLTVAATLDLVEEDLVPILKSPDKANAWWRDTEKVEAVRKQLTNYAKTKLSKYYLVLEKDPARADFPLFVLGRWLRLIGCPSHRLLDKEILDKTLKELIQRYSEIKKPPFEYLVQTLYKDKYGFFDSGKSIPGPHGEIESAVGQYLVDRSFEFDYEYIQFNFPDNSACGFLHDDRISSLCDPPSYKPDFILNCWYEGNRRVIIEPHGPKKDLVGFIVKLSKFKKFYGNYFYIVAIMPKESKDYLTEAKELAKTIQAEPEPWDYFIDYEGFESELDEFLDKHKAEHVLRSTTTVIQKVKILPSFYLRKLSKPKQTKKKRRAHT